MTAAAPAPIDVMAHQGLVRFVISRHGFARRAFGALDVEDLFQQGSIGLARAARSFDPARGAAFSTYAVFWIRAEIERQIDNVAGTVRVPVGEQHRRRQRGDPRVRPICRYLNAPCQGGDPEETWLDSLTDPDASDLDELLDRRRAASRLEELYDAAQLTPRERLVLDLRSGGRSLSEVAGHVGVSRERIRQIEAEALDRLRRVAGVAPSAPRVPIYSRKSDV